MVKDYEFIIDSREKFDLKNRVIKTWGLPFKEGALPCGDLALRYVPLGGKTRWLAGAERKKVNDLIQSIMKKRIFDQIKRMTELYDIGFLCVVGSLDETAIMLERDVGLKVNYNNVFGTLASIMVRNKYHLMWFPDDKLMFHTMSAIFTKIAEGKYGEPMRLMPKHNKYNPVSMLSDHVPGVNKRIAQRLMKRFGSIRAIAEAQPGHLTVVDGVGTSTANLIHRLLVEMKE